MKRTLRYIVLLCLAFFLASGCALFKKNCDCPSFGGKGRSHQRGPGW